jgi:hypothetical protein
MQGRGDKIIVMKSINPSDDDSIKTDEEMQFEVLVDLE